MYQRTHVQTLLSRFAEPVQRLLVVTGPRQTGKTTLVRQALELVRSRMDCEYIAVDEPTTTTSVFLGIPSNESLVIDPAKRDTRWLTEQWQRARHAADRSKNGLVLVLDEIHKIDQWSEAVKGLWDADRAVGRPMHVVLLGSAPLLIRRGLTESLAGRFEVIRVTHWSFLEMYEAFDLDLSSYLYFGGYPGGMPLMQEPARWKDYMQSALIDPNIEKDILMMARVDKPALLKRVFELGCHFSGQILSYTKMVGQLQDAGNTTTVAHYLDLLTNAGLLAGLQKFAGRQHRRRASSPKLNVLNTALMTVGSGYTFEEARADRTFWGRLVESAVGAHIYNTGMPDARLYYWRESSLEVDFIVERGGKTVCMEVKSVAGKSSVRGINAFREHFKVHNSLLIGGDGIPLERFLSSNVDNWFDLS